MKHSPPPPFTVKNMVEVRTYHQTEQIIHGWVFQAAWLVEAFLSRRALPFALQAQNIKFIEKGRLGWVGIIPVYL